MSKWALSEGEELADRQFDRWRILIEDRTGIYLSDDRRSLLKASLNSRMREVRSPDYDEYYDRVTKEVFGHQEWLKLLERLTVRETRFFRDPSALDYVRGCALQWFQSSEQASEPIAAWSVGCSTGEEVYSLAMLLKEVQAENGFNNSFSVLGTDISDEALAKASAGCYSARRADQVPEDFFSRYFVCNSDDSEYQIHPELKSRTLFEKLNILELSRTTYNRLSLIYCQNVLIYFRQATRHFILNQLAERLRPTGVLMLGMGEAVGWQNAALQPIVGQGVAAFVRRST